MGYEKEVTARARARHSEMVEQHRMAVRQRQQQIYQQYPRVRQLDNQIRMTMAQVMAQAFRQGGDPSLALEQARRENRSLQQERATILREAGYGAEYLNDGPLCKNCSDTGYVGETMCSCLEKFCREEQRKELTSLLSGSLCSFDDFSLGYYSAVPDSSLGISPREQMEVIYNYCQKYAREFSLRSKNLLMNGGTGLGKTFLSACIAAQVVELGYSVVYDTAIHVFSCLEKQKFGNADPEEKRCTQRVMDCDLLILDDLGTEMQTPVVSPSLYTIVNGRILGHKPTIISTNLSMDKISQRYTSQIASRLKGEYENLLFLGQDIRVQKAQHSYGE